MFLNKIRKFAATLTRSERYTPNSIWSNKCWTSNLFRAYEYIFGRRYGIKAEVTAGCYYDEVACKWKEYQVAHTFEASLAILEGQIRKLFTFKLPQLVAVPSLQFINATQLTNSPYRFAIAYDAVGQSTTGFGASAITWTHTTAGSDTVIFISSSEPETGGWSGMTVTYNSVSVTEIGKKAVSNATSDWYIALFGLLAPASGSNTVSVTSNNTLCGCSTSYSGVLQSGLPDSFAEVNSGGSSVTSLNCSTTVVASNCWLVLSARSQAGVVAAGTSTTLRGFGFMPTNKYLALLDSNGTVGTGSQTLQMTGPSGNMGGVIASFAPAGGGGGGAATPSLMTMGVGT